MGSPDFEMEKIYKGLWLKCEYESRAKKEANPLEVLAERSREKSSEEESKRQTLIRDNNKASNSLIEFLRGDLDGYWRQFRR